VSHLFDEPINEGPYEDPEPPKQKTEFEPGDPEWDNAPEKVKQAWAKRRLEALRERIETAGRGADYEHRTQAFRQRLSDMIDDLLWEQRGILTIEKTILEEIRKEELGSIR
jgi:hypothetical protein